MSDKTPNCPECGSVNCYHDGNLWVCPECFHEWSPTTGADPADETSAVAAKFLDANGVQLQDGDTVATIKDLKMGKETLKSGTKVKGIRLLEDPVDDHDISCKIPGHGSVYLKCSVVKRLK